MKPSIRSVFLVLFIFTGFVSMAQFPKSQQDVYRKPLKDVLADVEKTFQAKLVYQDNQVKDLNVEYATWRFTPDLASTLNNILNPLGLGYREMGNNRYRITPFEYYRRTEEEGKRNLDVLLSAYPNAEAFDKRRTALRLHFLQALGINPALRKSPLNPIVRTKVKMDGYTVENVAFESIPGYYVTGTLYTPAKAGKQFPIILSPNGHFYGSTGATNEEGSGRYRADMQYRCAALAKMGAIVLNYDMYSWGESILQTGDPSFHDTPFAIAIQTWNSIRALDFLFSLPNADKTRVGVTGASGGGTQTFIVSALDDRIVASAPVVMVSSSFFGGCGCECGLPIHDGCDNHKTNNAEIAAMFAPRPQLVISDGSDWTKTVPGTDYPYLRKVYDFYGKGKNVENVHLPNDQHDYGYTKREPMYAFFAKTLNLQLPAITGKDGKIDESNIKIRKMEEMLVFGKDFPLPPKALRSHADIMKAFKEYQSGN